MVLFGCTSMPIQAIGCGHHFFTNGVPPLDLQTKSQVKHFSKDLLPSYGL
jgi:hypothetical protein